MRFLFYFTFFFIFTNFFIKIGICHHHEGFNSYGLWGGYLKTEDGICPDEYISFLRIRDKALIFNPNSGAQVLSGEFKKNETHYHAELDETGMRGDPYHLVFDGYRQNNMIEGTFLTPRCRAHISLKKIK